MNPVEIEQVISELANETFNREEFPYAFLAAFGKKSSPSIWKIRCQHDEPLEQVQETLSC